MRERARQQGTQKGAVREASSARSSDLMRTQSIGPLFVRMAAPAVVAQLISLLYNIVDRIYIGHIPGIGTAALTGVGLFTPLLMLINAFAMLVGSGGAPRLSIRLGQGDEEGAQEILNASFRLLAVLAVVLTPLLFIFAPALLRFFGASGATLPYALTYARIYILGSVFVLMTYGLNTFISAQGFARTAMLSTVLGAVINIGLDPVLIFGCSLGVAGAAIATVLSQAVSAVWVLHFLFGRKGQVRIHLRAGRAKRGTAHSILSLGSSTFVMISTESLLSVTFNHSLSSYGGDLAVGAMTIITSLVNLVIMPLSGLAQGAAPIISYNYGAGESRRVRGTFRLLLGTVLVYSMAFWAVIHLFPAALARIFTGDAQLIAYTVPVMHIYFALIFTNAFQISCQQSFVALGQARISLFLACLRKLILLIPLILILPHLLPDPVFAVFVAEPISDVLAAAITTAAFLVRIRTLLGERQPDGGGQESREVRRGGNKRHSRRHRA